MVCMVQAMRASGPTKGLRVEGAVTLRLRQNTVFVGLRPHGCLLALCSVWRHGELLPVFPENLRLLIFTTSRPA